MHPKTISKQKFRRQQSVIYRLPITPDPTGLLWSFSMLRALVLSSLTVQNTKPMG